MSVEQHATAAFERLKAEHATFFQAATFDEADLRLVFRSGFIDGAEHVTKATAAMLSPGPNYIGAEAQS